MEKQLSKCQSLRVSRDEEPDMRMRLEAKANAK